MQNEAQQIIIIDLDIERKKMLKDRRAEWEKGEAGLQKIAADTGGYIRTPVDTEGLLASAMEIAEAIGLYYDLTYIPSRAISGATGQERAVSITSRSDAIRLKTRKTLTVGR
jgi:hypothetical protein